MRAGAAPTRGADGAGGFGGCGGRAKAAPAEAADQLSRLVESEKKAEASLGFRRQRRDRVRVVTGQPLVGTALPAPRKSSGAAAVDYALKLNMLKDSRHVAPGQAQVRHVAGRTFVLWRGVWIDRAFTSKLPRVKVKYLGSAYMKILDCGAKWRKILALGQYLVVVTPNGTALVVGDEEDKGLDDAKIAALFVPAKAKSTK